MSDSTTRYSSIEDITDAIRLAISSKPDETILVGIDGGGGSGKSTLANNLASSLDDSNVIHLDDFADWSDDSNWDLSTFADRALEPLLAGITSKHQRYDWPTGELGEWFEIPPTRVAIIEGVSSLRNALRKYWAISIWVECPRDIRLERGVARDGEEIRSKWENEWMPGEDAYFEQENPQAAAQFVYDGLGTKNSTA